MTTDWLTGNDRLLEMLERLAAGEPTTADELARLRFAATAARRRPALVVFDFTGRGCSFLTTSGQHWTPQAHGRSCEVETTAASLWVLAAMSIKAPGEWVPLPASRSAMSLRIGRALEQLSRVDAALAEVLQPRPGKGVGLHLERLGPISRGRLIRSARQPRLDVRARGSPV
jgi:hypothetical protein